MRIYIAGPYCPKGPDNHSHPREAQENVDKAIWAFNYLKELGHEPFVPHLSHYIHLSPYGGDYGGEFWYDYDLTFLDRWAEAICMIGDWENSKGSNLELERARKLGLKIFYLHDAGLSFPPTVVDFVEGE